MKKFLVLSALLPLCGCISFGGKVPDQLLVLTPATAIPVGAAKSSATAAAISIDVPVTPQSLATQRVPVQTSPTAIAYVEGAQWAEPPARLFARLLSDTMSATTGRVVLSGAEAFATPSAQLSGQLSMFGIDAATGEAVVTYDASLQRVKGAAVEKRRFEARVPAGGIVPANVGTALNDAANRVATEVAGWVGDR